MPTFAKIVGFLCMFGALFEVLFAAVVIFTADGGTDALTPGDSTGGLTAEGLLVLLLPVLFFLMLVAVGAAAFVVGEIAERQVEDLRRRGAPPPAGAYGASVRS